MAITHAKLGTDMTDQPLVEAALLDAVLAALGGHARSLTFNDGQTVRRLIAELRALSLQGSFSEQVQDRILTAFVDEWADKPGFAQLAALLLKVVLSPCPSPTFPLSEPRPDKLRFLTSI